MKNLAILALVLLVFKSFGQTEAPGRQTEAPGNKNELRLNLVYSLLEIPEITYERILGPGGAAGVSLGVAMDEDIGDIRFMALPYYRVYFGNSYASGFFLELNTIFASMRENSYGGEDANHFAFGLGLASGVKFLAKNTWLGEVTLGLGRYLGDAYEEYWIYPRFGISLGKRF